MLSQSDLVSFISGVVGAVVGATYAGPLGGAIGAVVSWLPVFVFSKNTEIQRLKRKILKTLTTSEAKQVRDVMACHDIYIPRDCFLYDENLPFVKALAKYKKALMSLESEGLITHSKYLSVSHGYVNPPHDWVNDWSGRVYKKLNKE